jgi:hypothetical protein
MDPTPGTEPNLLPVVEQPAPPCRHLRSKGMYVYTGVQESELEDDYDSTNYWCFETMKTFGPDDQGVGGRECRNSSRPCYEPI